MQTGFIIRGKVIEVQILLSVILVTINIYKQLGPPSPYDLSLSSAEGLVPFKLVHRYRVQEVTSSEGSKNTVARVLSLKNQLNL